MRNTKTIWGRSIIWYTEFQIIVILSVVFIIATQIFVYYYHKGKLEKCTASALEIKKALTLYAGDNSGKYPDNLQRLVPSYLSKTPLCPVRYRDTYSDSYTFSDDHRRCTFYCSGKNHENARIRGNLPIFSLP